MGRYQRGFRRRQGRKGIVRDGLMLHLDGRDFKNNPATNLWYDRVRSETVGYTNAVTNGDFSDAATGWTLWSANLNSAAGEAIFTGTNVGAYPNIYKTLTATVGRKYYFTAEVMVEDATDIVRLAIRSESVETAAVQDAPVANTWYKLSCVKTSGNTSMTFAPSARYTSAATATGKKVHVRKCMAIDLTALFGSANEPDNTESNLIFPFTATQSTTHRSSDYNPENMVKYNPVTWSEFTKGVGTTGDTTGLTVTNDCGSTNIPTNLKTSTKYGMIVNVISNTYNGNLNLFSTYTGRPFSASLIQVGAGVIGNLKGTATTQSSITENKMFLYSSATGTAKLKDIRVFELPTGSQIESDFTNLTADQLAIKYPMQRAALPYNFGYIAPYAQITSDFVGKVAGSVVENPNVSKVCAQSTLAVPSSVSFPECSQAKYTAVSTLNSANSSNPTSVLNNIPQQLFSFNLIEIFERRYGTIPSTDQTTAGKVAWLKANLSSMYTGWYGYGSKPTGNKAYLSIWNSSAWYGAGSHTSASVAIIESSVTGASGVTLAQAIQADGFVHFLAYTDASDGVTASIIYTDYIKLDLTFKAASGSDNAGGVVFDGVDDSIQTQHLGFTGNAPFTLMVKGQLLSNAAGDDVMFAYTYPTTPASKTFGLYARSSGAKFRVSTWSVNDYDTGFNKDYVEHVWALVYDGTGTLLYQDGVVDSVGKKTATNPSFTTDCIFIAGKIQDANFANFKLKKAIMYSKVLTAQEIIQSGRAI